MSNILRQPFETDEHRDVILGACTSGITEAGTQILDYKALRAFPI